MKFLSILMVGAALFVGGYGEKGVAKGKPAKEESTKPDPIREASRDELEKRDGIWYFKGETEPFTGTAILLYEDGSKRSEAHYVNGKIHGMLVYYYEDGSKKNECPFVNGEQHGISIWYNEDGSKKRETPYVNDKRHGMLIYYHKDGSTNTTEWVHDTGTVMHFYEDGSKMSETPYVNRSRHGTVIRYRKDGSKWWETVYENGKKISHKKF